MGMSSPLQAQITIYVALLIIFSSSTTFGSNLPIAKHHCQDTCGGISIPFPFGTNENCYLSQEFKVTCDNNSLLFGNIPVIKIAIEGQLWIQKRISYICYKENGEIKDNVGDQEFIMTRRSFNFNSFSNVFIVVGCDSYAYLNGKLYRNLRSSTGCISFCRSIEEVSSDNGECSGPGCCQAKIPNGISNLTTSLATLNRNYTYMNGINNCIYTFIVEEKSFRFTRTLISKQWTSDRLPAVLDWAIVDNNCRTAKASADYACKGNTFCINIHYPTGYRCHCKQGYKGNPYLDCPGGCNDVDECKVNNCKKNSACKNTPGNYTCNCLQGYEGDGFLDCKGGRFEGHPPVGAI